MPGTISLKPAAVLGKRAICDHTPKPDISFTGSPLALGSPQIDKRSVADLPSKILDLSPSLFSSPGKMLPENILEDGTQYLTQGEHPELDLMLGSFRKCTVMCPALCYTVRDTQGFILSRPCLREPTV